LRALDGTPPTNLLSLERLNVYLGRGANEVRILSDLSFAIRRGEIVGMVGESGCGKTLTGLSILGLLPERASRVTGRILFDGVDLVALPPHAIEAIRGKQISMVFQDAAGSLDPVFTVGHQIAETVKAHFRVDAKEARERAVAALASVGIPMPSRRYHDYPHQFSGGMRQRVMIAIALACEPRLLIADEPTTALDVTVQAQILGLLVERAAASGTALLFITHDLGVVGQTCSRVLTMYAGELVEDGPVDEVLSHPRHPYTAGLLRSLPRLSPRKSVLPSIPGRVLPPAQYRSGCRFAERCGYRLEGCDRQQDLDAAGDRLVRCWRQSEINLPNATA
jgi:peptide/nickel transport system ATP-binding protein